MKRIVTVLLLCAATAAAGAVDRPGQKFLLKASDLPSSGSIAVLRIREHCRRARKTLHLLR